MTSARAIARKTVRRKIGRVCTGATGLSYSREIDTEIGSTPVPDGVEGHQLGDLRRVGITR